MIKIGSWQIYPKLDNSTYVLQNLDIKGDEGIVLETPDLVVIFNLIARIYKQGAIENLKALRKDIQE